MSTENQNLEQEEIVNEVVEPTIKFTVESGSEPIAEVKQQVAEVIEEKPPVVEETPQPPAVIADEKDINEATAWKILKERKGIEVESIDDLLKPREEKRFSPAMEKFNEFIEKTGNDNYNDFLETQKDWSTESEDVTLKTYLKLSNPALDEREVNRLYEKKYGFGTLDAEDEDDIDAITDIKIERKTDLTKAVEFFNKRKEEFSAVGGSDAHIPQDYREAKQTLESLKQQEEEGRIIYEQERQQYVSHIESVYSDDFKGFELSLGNNEIGFEKVFIKPENMKEERDYISDIDNFNKRFYDEKGKLVDQEGFKNALIKERNYDRDMNIAFNLGFAKKAELDDRLSKNIQPENIRPVIDNKGGSGIIFTAEK